MKIIALDIGGTAVKSGLVDNGVLKEHRETPTPAAEGGQAVVALAKKLIAAYLPEGAVGIGISTAGVVDSKSGSILFAEDCIRGYTGIQVKALLEDAFSLPTAVENDLNAAAVGEAAFGAGKGCKSLLCVGFGTSVGGAAVLDGRLYTGSHFGAGEFGLGPGSAGSKAGSFSGQRQGDFPSAEGAPGKSCGGQLAAGDCVRFSLSDPSLGSRLLGALRRRHAAVLPRRTAESAGS